MDRSPPAITFDEARGSKRSTTSTRRLRLIMIREEQVPPLMNRDRGPITMVATSSEKRGQLPICIGLSPSNSVTNSCPHMTRCRKIERTGARGNRVTLAISVATLVASRENRTARPPSLEGVPTAVPRGAAPMPRPSNIVPAAPSNFVLTLRPS